MGVGRDSYLVGITRTDEGVAVDIVTPEGDAVLGSTYAPATDKSIDSEPVTGDSVIGGLVDEAANFIGGLHALAGGECGDPVPVEQASLDSLKTIIRWLQDAVYDLEVFEAGSAD